ncbi:MAG: glycosyltransferase [Propionibacteriaceae bacterium]
MKIALLSTYPPTQCGLATFTQALGSALSQLPGTSVSVVRAVDRPPHDSPPVVVENLVAGDALSQRRAADALSSADVAVVQHEYGIYGGADGREVLTVLRQVKVPLIVVLHTVLRSPSVGQRQVLEHLCRRADAVVVMSRAARERLTATYALNARKVHVIPHGVAVEVTRAGVRPVPGRILTWGLIGPGKGIEWGIRALASLQDIAPQPEYLVAGQTHPKVLESHGEAYRDSLRQLAEDLHVDHLLRFDASYRPTSALPDLIASASAVLLPYESDEQVTSGVLIEAVAAGRPVVATSFPHATELLAAGAGATVPHRDPAAMADALRAILTRPDVAASMAAAARSASARLSWPVVAQSYRSLAERLSVAFPSPGDERLASG